ncbi:YbgF trimerization domain-containing protein [Gilvimarinus agarilyticus]|uniref:YbgF trimerization domain-containing protein n=1 Tax=Gilvimarinus agarilyticus TaxID=679259 RepID=UPI00059F28B6|nr:YbgF trimerization domain-containing protein [Gilvimarinus agarilyticus]
MRAHLLVAATLVAAVSTAQAQVQVTDSSPQSAAGRSADINVPGARQSVPTPSNSNPQAELFYQLQALQQEVMTLRGLVEEQAFELKRLKQQRLDDYLDLDRRVSALTTGAAGTAAATPRTAGAPSESEASFTPDPAPTVSAGGADAIAAKSVTPADASESEVYGAAYELLRQRQVDESIAAFKDHLTRFPNGEYTGNSYYWLGEIYLLKNDLPAAQQWFSDLLREFPDSRKVPDAQFKLGKVYHLQGQDARAKELLNIVASSNSDASRLAQQYLKESF